MRYVFYKNLETIVTTYTKNIYKYYDERISYLDTKF